MKGTKTVFVENELGKFSFDLERYQTNKKPAIVCSIFDDEMGIYAPYATVSVNLEHEIPEENVCISVHNLPDEFKKMLFDEKILLGDINSPVMEFTQGFVTFPVYEYNRQLFVGRD